LSYEKLIPALANHFTVLAPDFPGYGQSDETSNAYTTEGLIEFVTAFLDALGLDTVDVAGLSMGGGVALGMAIHNPNRIRHAVLMGSHGMTRRSWPGFTSAVLTRLPASFYAWSWRFTSSNADRARRAMRRVWADHSLLTQELLEDIRRELARPGAWKVVRTWARSESGWRGLRTYYLKMLPQVRTPVLLIHGAKDKLVPVSSVKRAAKVLPEARLLLLPECGHWIPRECPDELIEAINDFLMSTSPDS
jgi:pimeloyl-ACP methyl ester carboxylesterase